MAQRVDLNKDYIVSSLQASIASLKRRTTNEKNQLMKELIDKDIAAYQNAINTITDTK